MIYIVVPVFNRWLYTQACLSSLQKQTYKQLTILVVNHGSTDETSQNLNKYFPEVLEVKGDSSMWWTAATNLGVSKALDLSQSKDDFILTINNDLIVEEDYLAQLLEVYNINKPAVIGSISVDIQNPEEIHFAGIAWNPITAKYKTPLNKKTSLSIIQSNVDQIVTDLLPGRGVLIPIKCFKELGLYDQKNFPHYMADEEFALRCKRNGYKLFISTKAVVYSHINETGLKQQNRRNNLSYWKSLLTSIKSPNNLNNRWKWAKRTSPIPILYFFFDFSRIIYSQHKAKRL